MYCLSYAKDGSPIIYNRKSKFKSNNYQLELKAIVYTLEQTIKQMKGSSTKWYWILDMYHHSSKNSPPFSISKKHFIFSNVLS